jgi:hypothetical protein
MSSLSDIYCVLYQFLKVWFSVIYFVLSSFSRCNNICGHFNLYHLVQRPKFDLNISHPYTHQINVSSRKHS